MSESKKGGRKSSDSSCSSSDAPRASPSRKLSLPEKVVSISKKAFRGLLQMDVLSSSTEFYYKVKVKTGNKLGAGTDSNVYLEVEDAEGRKTGKEKLDHRFVNDHEMGKEYWYNLKPAAGMGRAHTLHVFRDSKGVADSWFLDHILVEHVNSNHEPTVFPVWRWIRPHHKYILREYDSALPMYSHDPEGRAKELEERRKEYLYAIKVHPNGPIQVSELPYNEKFAPDFFLEFIQDRLKLLKTSKWIKFIASNWKSLDDIEKVFNVSSKLPPPEYSIKYWKEDWYFGLTRIQGVNPSVIKLCREIPQGFHVTDVLVQHLIDGLTIQQAIADKKLFIIDYKILEGIPTQEGTTLCIPFALFFVKDDVPMPVAIQLQRKDDSPVFTPDDDPHLWQIVKMWCNNADASHHQACSHLGLTHLIMEGVCVCTHRNLSPSHPLFKLLAPHFLYLLAINARGLDLLIAPGGWIDKTMAIGVKGTYELISKGCEQWDFVEQGNVDNLIRNNGTTPDVLKYYPYRDDALDIFRAIRAYVDEVVRLIYAEEDDLLKDQELRNWRLEMTRPKISNGATGCGGLGLKNVPGDDLEGFRTVEEVIETRPKTEEEILALIPSKTITLDVMTITRLLSRRGTNKLGDFEVQYLYDPKYTAIVDKFRSELARLSNLFKHKTRKLTYDCLDPDGVPNSISI
ncbi:unnamed protein product [Notodromas monacha]|uniref:Uncharacterized protein n=1 Tax=Notodromas monacha TaxID=399045 RepID=A0A7R9BPH2_9CRUS|nr:unnamed protein product [Notodromas monacha]CAG0917897.1 unnamed protein product [Notodromas monacha]